MEGREYKELEMGGRGDPRSQRGMGRISKHSKKFWNAKITI